jgi:hypothetical protein
MGKNDESGTGIFYRDGGGAFRLLFIAFCLKLFWILHLALCKYRSDKLARHGRFARAFILDPCRAAT